MTISIESPIVDRKGNRTTVYRLMSRIIDARLRKRYDDGPDRDDASQTAMAHAWQRFVDLAADKPELTIEERAVLAARFGAWRTDRPITSEPRPFRYVDAMDYVSTDDDVFHLPSHAGRQRYWLMTVSESVELPASERDAMIARLPAQLRLYATLAAQGVTQTRIAERRGEAIRTTKYRMAQVKAAIAELAPVETVAFKIDGKVIVGVVVNRFDGGNWNALREWVLEEHFTIRADNGRQWSLAARHCTPVTTPRETEAEAVEAENEAIRECNEHASLVVNQRTGDTDRYWRAATSPMGLPITLEGSEPRTPSHIVADIDDIKRVARPTATEPAAEPVTYWQTPYMDYVRSQSALRAASSWAMWK